MEHQPIVSFKFCDFTSEYHCTMLATLINHYISDPMGGGTPLNGMAQLRLVDGLANHPGCFVLFAFMEDAIVGMTTCFINFSTFKCKPFINIHDLIVLKEFRSLGIGKALLRQCCNIATERKYCKVTLEVRDDNANAQRLYKNVGFASSEPNFQYWTKAIIS